MCPIFVSPSVPLRPLLRRIQLLAVRLCMRKQEHFSVKTRAVGAGLHSSNNFLRGGATYCGVLFLPQILDCEHFSEGCNKAKQPTMLMVDKKNPQYLFDKFQHFFAPGLEYFRSKAGRPLTLLYLPPKICPLILETQVATTYSPVQAVGACKNG